MPTTKLYDKNAYETVFHGCVLSCLEKCEEKNADKEHILYDVELDRTLFFPEEGGQSPDKGVLGGANVLDVQIKNDVIIHTVDKPLTEGETVEGEIDWSHRFSNMQQHSGEHIFSGLVYQKYGFLNVGFHLSNQIVTMDFDGPLTKEQVDELEWEVNRVITENVKVTASYPTQEELEQIEYRSKKEIEGAIRIVEIKGYDLCACCAPHVAYTGEIGGFKIQTVQKYKGGVRISFLCGFRALEEARKKAGIITELSGILTTNQELLADNIQKLKNKSQSLQLQLNAAKQALMELKIERIPMEQEHVFIFEEELEVLVIRNTVNKLVEQHAGICGVFVGDEKAGYNFIIGSKNKDCRQIAAAMRERFNARGGGSAVMIQGSVAAEREAIKKLLLEL